MYVAAVRRPFKVYHFLVGDFEGETEPHTHQYEMEWRLSVADLDNNGFSVDLALMKDVVIEGFSGVEGVLLNDLPYFATRQTSLENFGEFMTDILLEGLPAPERQRLVRSELVIWEDPETWSSIIREPVNR